MGILGQFVIFFKSVAVHPLETFCNISFISLSVNIWIISGKEADRMNDVLSYMDVKTAIKQNITTAVPGFKLCVQSVNYLFMV